MPAGLRHAGRERDVHSGRRAEQRGLLPRRPSRRIVGHLLTALALALGLAVSTTGVRAAQPTQSDRINTSGRGGNIVADARAWWGRHSDDFRTQTSHCLGLLDEAEQHRQTAMQYYEAARRARHEEASRLQRLHNEEYAIVSRLVRQFYECARTRSDQFSTRGGDNREPPPPGSDEVSTYGSGRDAGRDRPTSGGTGGGTGGGSGGTGGRRLPERPTRVPPPPGGRGAARSDRFETICDQQRLAALLFERYNTERPIARWRVANASTPTYLLTLSGFDFGQAGRGKNTVGQLLLGLMNVQVLDAYRVAIFKAVADLDPGTNLIIVGHSQGGMEAQNVVRNLVERWGYRVPMVVSYGAPITTDRRAGTGYLHVRAPDDWLPPLDRRYDFSDREIVLSNRGTPDPHMSYPTPASGLSLFRVPSVSTLSTPCWEIEVATVREYEVPDLFTQFFGPPSPRAGRTPLNPHAGMAGDPNHVPGRRPMSDEGPNEDVNCFWVAVAKDKAWATGLDIPATCESRPTDARTIREVLERQYGDVPLDDLHGPTAADGRTRHQQGRKVETDRAKIERALGRGDKGADGRRGLVFVHDPQGGPGHVFNARNVGGRIEYWDEQQGYDSEFQFFTPGMQFRFYRTN